MKKADGGLVGTGAVAVAEPKNEPKSEPKKTAGQSYADRVLGAQPRAWSELSSEEPLKEGERIGTAGKQQFKVKYVAGQLPTTVALGSDALVQIERQETAIKVVVGKSFSRAVTFADDTRRASAQMEFLKANGLPLEETIEKAGKIIDSGM